jgi:prophage antirepressor-like protein
MRVIVKDGEPWFVAKDVAEILGYIQSSDLARRLDDDEKGKVNAEELSYSESGHGQCSLFGVLSDDDSSLMASEKNSYAHNLSVHATEPLTIINESGLYRAIFGSQRPEARKFKKWVCSEVLPSIRKHGAYMTPSVVQSIIADPRKAIELLTELVREQDARKIAEEGKEQAIRERAWISDKKTATAMATASHLSRKVSKLQEELGSSKKAASILRVSIALGVPEKSFAWHHLKKTTLELDMEIKKIPDPRFGFANLYPAEAWKAAYGIDLEELFGN